MFSKNPRVATTQAAELAEDGLEGLLEEGDKAQKLEELIHFIGLLDQRRIDREISLDASIFENYEDALDALRNQSYSEVREFLQNIEEAATRLARNIDAQQIDVEEGEMLGRGLNDEVYEIADDKVLRVLDTEVERAEQLAQSKMSKIKFGCVPDEVNVPEIHRVGVHDGFSARVEEKAPGQPLHEYDETYDCWSRRLETLAKAPQEHYDKLIEDARALEEYGLTVDGSNADNVFYDEEEGFTLVDINHGGSPDLSNKPNSFVTLVTAVNYSRRNEWEIEESDLDNLCTIHHKLRKAGDPYKDDFERRMALKSYPQADIPEEQKPPEPETTVEITGDYCDNLPDNMDTGEMGYGDLDLNL